MGIDRTLKNVTLSSIAIQRAAAYWIFPGLVAAMIAGNEGWRVGPFLAGQMLSWLNDSAAVVLVLGRFRGRRWPFLLVAGTLLAKLLTLAGVAASRSDLAFDAGLGLLFCAAGAVIVAERPGIVYRQLIAICALSLPLMVLQMTGLAPWSEALNTEHTEDVRQPQPTLLVPEADLHYRTAQARPSGFTHSNNFLSFLASLAVALHLAHIATPRLTRRDVIVCAFVVLTMAKISFLIFVAALAWTLVTGVARERRRIIRILGLTAVLLAAYAAVFPGLFAANTSSYKITYSVMIRVNDFVALLPDDGLLKGWLRRQLAGTPTAGWDTASSLSGYAQIIRALPFVLVAALLAAPLIWQGVGRLRRRYPAAVDLTTLMAFVTILYPAAVPLFRAQIFWFAAGFCLLPVFLVWEPRRFPGRLGLLWPSMSRPLGGAA